MQLKCYIQHKHHLAQALFRSNTRHTPINRSNAIHPSIITILNNTAQKLNTYFSIKTYSRLRTDNERFSLHIRRVRVLHRVVSQRLQIIRVAMLKKTFREEIAAAYENIPASCLAKTKRKSSVRIHIAYNVAKLGHHTTLIWLYANRWRHSKFEGLMRCFIGRLCRNSCLRQSPVIDTTLSETTQQPY